MENSEQERNAYDYEDSVQKLVQDALRLRNRKLLDLRNTKRKGKE